MGFRDKFLKRNKNKNKNANSGSGHGKDSKYQARMTPQASNSINASSGGIRSKLKNTMSMSHGPADEHNNNSSNTYSKNPPKTTLKKKLSSMVYPNVVDTASEKQMGQQQRSRSKSTNRKALKMLGVSIDSETNLFVDSTNKNIVFEDKSFINQFDSKPIDTKPTTPIVKDTSFESKEWRLHICNLYEKNVSDMSRSHPKIQVEYTLNQILEQCTRNEVEYLNLDAFVESRIRESLKLFYFCSV